MGSSNYDVVVVGAGCAGLTAAIGLARANFAVAVVEAAAYPGAENWSGCVYFAEQLAQPDILGPEGVEALAWERRLVERGFFATDGRRLLGLTYRDPQAFRHCYTVLRPIYDHHLAQVARKHGVALLTETTAESLIRDRRRVVGIATNRGPLYGDLVFLAEGDASHLVTREGYERDVAAKEGPKFLQGIKQVWELPAGAIEERFRVGPEEGVAYEMLLRNGRLRGRPVHLNAGGFLYANRRSLSIGLVLPADNLRHFEGDPNLLMEWFESLPALAPWLKDGQRGAFGAKLIRGGGAKEIPTLVDDGLAIGGAASGIGIDFPYPNFTGPATLMGRLLAHAAARIRDAGGDFSAKALQQHYLDPLHQTHYWKDVEFLRDWPGYVKKTQVFFDRQVDLALDTAELATRSDLSLLGKGVKLMEQVRPLLRGPEASELRADFRHFAKALRLREVVTTPGWGQWLFDATLNTSRDLAGRPRPDLKPTGTIELHYRVGSQATFQTPRLLQWWFRRFAPGLAMAAGRVYANNDRPLADKLPLAVRQLCRQVSLIDVLLGGAAGVAAGLGVVWNAFWRRRKRAATSQSEAPDLTPLVASATQNWEGRLGHLAYQTMKDSHIHVHWPQTLPDKNGVVKDGLWHVCPARVYEARVNATGQVQVVVNFENCIKCETCWRTSGQVDWGRDGQHRFVYPVHSPVVEKLIADAHAAALVPAVEPRSRDWWAPLVAAAVRQVPEDSGQGVNGEEDRHAEMLADFDKLERKLEEFDEALAREPRTIDRPRAAHFDMLARYARQLALLTHAAVQELADASPSPIKELATDLVEKANARIGRCAEKRFAWAASTGRLLRQHHLVGLRRLLQARGQRSAQPYREPTRAWLADARDSRSEIATRLDAALGPTIWRDLERQTPLTSEQDALLRDLLAQVPAIDPANLAESVHPPPRKALLAELGRRDPSLAFRAMSHLWARDLARLAGLPGADAWARGDEWACLAMLEAGGVMPFVPTGSARSILVVAGDRAGVVATHEPPKGVAIEPVMTLGLRGAGVARLVVEDLTFAGAANGDDLRRAWTILSSADLIAAARGMAELLCDRAIAHATNRVQFPGLFHDEQARDAIGKFGAVKKMIAEMGAARALLDIIDEVLTPQDLSPETARRTSLLKALAAELLGTSPGSLSYNAGQVFGGTGFSEDDVLSKYYRDAAAWRFLGPGNRDVFDTHGEALMAGEALASFADEAGLFQDIVQRQGLHTELHHLQRLQARLAECLGTARDREALARQDALLLAGKALLLRTHALLENGIDAETAIALLRVWLERVALSMARFTCPASSEVDPAPASSPAIMLYKDYLSANAPYDSGDFLKLPANPFAPRYVPEMLHTDAELAARDREFERLMTEQFAGPRQGMPYERYLEQQHRPDAADLDFCRQHGFFRMPIPRELGGEGRPKVDYYRLTTHAHRIGDLALSLTIQVNTSLSTTPIFLARDKDLPKARKEMAAFLADTGLHQEIQTRLTQLAALSDPEEIEAAFKELHKQLEEAVFSRSAVKVLAHAFAETWQKAGRAAKLFDFATMQGLVQEAAVAWQEACRRAGNFQQELGRRLDACSQHLRWIASGQIAAFALTEPSAGSDTARVATRAHLCSVPVYKDDDGVLRFVPAGSKEPRTLLDARRIEFRRDPADEREYRAYYRWSDQATPAAIRFDEYDYETDDPRRMRYYERDGRRIHFSDIAQLRERDGRLWYDYWELTGSKMWITNGRVMGVMALYAKTAEGITAFLVDRHAEGLIVGKDEEKMGQCGSPTNEVALQSLRVPRENVLGLEGRGQVNALETLNVGRAGLAMSTLANMPTLIACSRDAAADRSAGKLAIMEENHFIGESVAFEMIGRFEHKQTKSVRLESAIAKMLVSELWHQMIELAEEIHGLDGQTRRHVIEKRKRDARVLNIYEGTNEIQRFFILRDLGAFAGAKPEGAAPVQPEAQALEALKDEFKQRLNAAVALFGPNLGQDPSLQADGFLLAEAAAWLKAADSTLGRIAWLRATREGPPEWADRLDIGGRALKRCAIEVRSRLARFDDKLAALRNGFYDPAIPAAALLFEASGRPECLPDVHCSEIARPLAILVVVEPSPAGVPQPYVEAGQLLEAHWSLNAADCAALETALRLREQAEAAVAIHVACAGPSASARALAEAVHLGVDSVHLLQTEAEALAPAAAAAALANVLHDALSFDLILGGAAGEGVEEGLVARLTAEALGVTFAGNTAHLAVRVGDRDEEILLVGADQRQRVRSLPAGVGIEAGMALRPYSTADYLNRASRRIQVQPWPRRIEIAPLHFAASASLSDGEVESVAGPIQPGQAARLILDAVGLGGANAAVQAYEGPIDDVTTPAGLEAPVVAVLAADGDGRLAATWETALTAARLLARRNDADVALLMLTPDHEEAQRRAAAQVRLRFAGNLVLLPAAHADGSPEVRARLLRECWPAGLRPPLVVVGEPWSEAAFSGLSRRLSRTGRLGLRGHRLELANDRLTLETRRAGGKLISRRAIDLVAGKTWWISLTGDAEMPEDAAGAKAVGDWSGTVQRWSPRLERFFGGGDMQRLLDELKQETGLVRLTDAAFIIDVGFGVGNRDGYEAVIEPLERTLRELGVRSLMIGGSRKVTEELHLLPADRQIGQSGVSVNPQVLLAIGISGAPQHIHYIGGRATIVSFNRDAGCPLMTLNQRQARPRVFPVVGDLFETVPAFIAGLRQESFVASSV